MARLVIRFSEDFREARTASKIYVRLRDNGLEPFSVQLNYHTKLGEQEVIYYFENSDKMPKKSKLVDILEGIKFTTLTLD
ncbi:MAG: hypothetical protein AABX79_01815 [Nanoarchaeota archaeon]